MLTLTFLQQTKLDITKIAEVWRKFVTQQQVFVLGGGSRWRISFQVQPEDSSYRYRALMQKPQLVLKFSLPFYFEFPVGTQCVFQNQRFILTRAQNLKKQGTRKIEYSMTLGTNEDYFAQWKIRNIVDPVESGENAPKDNRLKFSLCAKPHEFVDLIVRNLNKKDTSVTWSRGECIEAAEKTVEFNHTYIDAGLTDICNAFSTEYEVEYLSTTAAKIHLRRVEYFKTDPVALSYGVGNGFIPGVGRTSEADGLPVKRMLVQGSDRNIDRSKYGAPELMLPKSQTIRYDGTHFEDEDGFNEAIARTYQSNADRDGVERIDKVSDAIKEDSLDCSEIYPSRIGEVTSVEVANAEKNFYDIIDTTIPPELNFNNYLIAGETMTIIFQDGMLAGKEFDVKYKHEQRKFEIVPQEIDGIMMPNETWCPQKEQTYAIFGIMLPDQYICNDSDKSGGSWDMMRAAVKALYEVEDQRFTFSGSLQALWAKRHWLDVGGKLVVGGHVLFQDDQFAKDGAVIRIVGIKDFLTQPYSPTIELSNSVSAGGSVASQIRQITNTEVVIEDTEKRMMQYTKRRFRDALETIGMLEDAHIGDFTGSVSPVAVQTMAMLVGDESLQFVIGNNIITAGKDDWQITYDSDKKQLFCPSGWLKHLTLGINSIKSSHTIGEYMFWQMPEFVSPVLDIPNAKFYLYAKVNRTDRTVKGDWVLSEKSILMQSDESSYHLLVGILNAEVYGERSFVQLNGFTEILPGRITTDSIVCSDGISFLDLAKSALVLGDAFDYNSHGDKTLRLKFLLSENANLGGWIFRNNRLESQNGNVWLDGHNGNVRLAGTIQMSSEYSGNYSDSNLFWLPPTDTVKHITMGYEEEDIGKVVRLFNSNPFGGASCFVHLHEFTINGNVTAAMNEIQAEIAPQETIEVTCFRRKPNGSEISAFWTITNRFGLESFRNKTECGRFPQLIASGTIYGKEHPQISGVWFDGRSVSDVLEISRESVGKYVIKKKDEKLISSTGSYFVMLTGIENDNGSSVTACYGKGAENTGIQFRVIMRVGNNLSDGYANFMIYTYSGWEYNMK